PTHPERPRSGHVICAVAEDGVAYAVLVGADGRNLEGTPSSGRLLDLVRSKFGMPAGPASSFDLELRGGLATMAW
ncbi:MAG: hypothetical protein ACRDZX_03815, partial [Acidimicrobiales bacterium]